MHAIVGNTLNHSASIVERDKQYIWHPYSSVNNDNPLYAVASASGVRIKLEDGRELIDGMSSWWSTLHGYNHPELNQAVIEQTQKMAHVMFGGLTHEPAVSLSEKLVQLSPEGLSKVFLCDSGSVAVEVAMKMAIQFWLSQGDKRKNRLLSLRSGYHGDTFAAMSVCDPITGMHHMFSEVLREQVFTESPQCKFNDPWQETYIQDFQQKISDNSQDLAAVILEPIVQGTGGMKFYSPEFLHRVRQLCDQHNVLLIADEIATGFGRTGKLFACEHAQISPDIMCLGKTLTGGYMTLAATLCTEKIAEGICNGEAGVFMHGPTFMGNPLACAVANKSIELLLKNNWQQQVSRIEQQLTQELAPAASFSHVKDVRVLGGIGVIELHNPVDLRVIQPRLVDKGIWLRPFGSRVYTMPPYIIDQTDLSQLTQATCEVVEELETA